MVAATIVRPYELFEIYQNLPGAPVNYYIKFFSKVEVFWGLILLVLIMHPNISKYIKIVKNHYPPNFQNKTLYYL